MAQPKRKQRERVDERPESEPAAGEPWKNSPGLTRRGWIILGSVIALANLPLIARVLRPHQEANVSLPYTDDFSDEAHLSTNYWTSGGLWRTWNGELFSPGVRNNPLWLKAKLPQDISVEFDVHSESPEGDIKVEIFGDGLNHASGYILIHGGWNNSVSVIARLDEHGMPAYGLDQQARAVAAQRGLPPNASWVDTGVFRPDTAMRVEANPFPVQRSKKYHWKIERRGSLLSWSIDGQPFMQFDDPFPLVGETHNRFGFSSWEADLYFDNLKVTPL